MTTPQSAVSSNSPKLQRRRKETFARPWPVSRRPGATSGAGMSLADQMCGPTRVQVSVQQARGLRVKGKAGTNDAYAVMQVGKEKFQTSVAEKSVAPVWGEEAAFDLPPGGGGGGGGGGKERSTLHVHVLHRALVGPDKLLGQAVVNLPQLSEDKTRSKTEWFKLLDKSGKADKDRGEVLLDIRFMRNDMTSSMFDLSAGSKSRSRLGKFKDKVRGKKRDSDSVSNVPSFNQVLTESEEEEEEEGEAHGEKKKPKKSLFSHKSNLQRNMSQSMTVLTAKALTLSGSQSSVPKVDSSEGKKKFKFLIHKRSDGKDASSGHQKAGCAEQSNVCINGSHVYRDQPPARASRSGSNFSLASSGHGSMEDVPESFPSSIESLRAMRQYSPWMEEQQEEEEEEEEELENTKDDVGQLRSEAEDKIGMEEMKRGELERSAGEKTRRDETRTEGNYVYREKEEMIRCEEEERMRQEEKERLREECERLDEQKRLQEQERLIEEEGVRKEEERVRQERMKEEEMLRRQEERRRLAEQESRRMEEEERAHKVMRREEEERLRGREEEEERLRGREEEEERLRRREEEEERLRKREEEKERLRRWEEEKERLRRQKEEEEEEEEERLRRQEEEEEERLRRQEEEEERLRRQKEEEERLRRQKEEEERLRRQKEEEEERLRRQKEEEEERLRRQKEEEEERLRRQKEEEEERLRRQKEEEEERLRRREEEERLRRQKEEEEERLRRQKEEERLRRREEEERLRKREEEKLRRQKEKEEQLRKREEEERLRKREEEEEERLRKQKEEEEEERLRRQEERLRKQVEDEKTAKRLEEERVRRLKEEECKLSEEKRIMKEEERRVEQNELSKEEERIRRIAEEERTSRDKEIEKRKHKEKRELEERMEEEARREKEEQGRLVNERRRLEEEEGRRLEAEENVRREEEERMRVEEERRKEKEQKLQEEKRILEAQERRLERKRREEEEMIAQEKRRREESARKEKEEHDRLVVEKMRRREQEKSKIEEQMKRQEEEERLRRESQEKEMLVREAQKKNPKTKAAGKKPTVAHERPEVPSNNPFDENFSNNPFEELPDSLAAPGSGTANVSTVQQRSEFTFNLCEIQPWETDTKCPLNVKDLLFSISHTEANVRYCNEYSQACIVFLCLISRVQFTASSVGSKAVSSDEKDPQRERRAAPRPPGRDPAESGSRREQDGSAQINKKSQGPRTVSVLPQRSVQMIAPLSRPHAEKPNPENSTQSRAAGETSDVAKPNKRTAPPIPRPGAEGPASEQKTHSTASSLNPFEEEEADCAGVNAATEDSTTRGDAGSVEWPPVASTKIKSSKARAPPLPAPSSGPDAGGGRAAGGAGVAGEPAPQARSPVRVEEPPLREDEGGKMAAAPVASRRLQPVKPLNPLEQQSASAAHGVTDTGLKGPYSQLTRGELVSLVLKQEKQLSERDKTISELEQYIDNLLVRVIEEKPSILLSLNSLKRAT
ncbi:uncharacterized protein rab11fip1b isoform 1-T1 [Spinachia spinachia]